jgi:hypothetical protein
VFDLLKQAFTKAPILAHSTLKLPLSSSATHQAKELHLITFFIHSMQSAELNYNVYDKELLAIVECFQIWHPYLEGSVHMVQVYTDHNNLQYFTTTKQLSRLQAQWSEQLLSFNYIINYRPGQLDAKADVLM